jgi:hypothetical protein
MREAHDGVSGLSGELKAAILRKQVTLLSTSSVSLTKRSVLRLNEPVLLSHELFTAAERKLDALKATDAPCCVWKPSDRYSTCNGANQQLPLSWLPQLTGESPIASSRFKGST